MAWLFGSQKKTPTGQSDVRAARDRQINNLHERVPGLRVESTDNSLFEVQISGPDGTSIMLRVFLPTKFPAERPVLQLLSPVTHPWVNTYMQVVGHPDLHGWDSTNPPLVGDIVASVTREFSRGTGGVNAAGHDQWGGTRRQPSGALPASGANNMMNSHASVTSSSPVRGMGEPIRTEAKAVSPKGRGRDVHTEKARQPKHVTPIPAIPVTFSELRGLSTEKLCRLLDDESARQALLLGMVSVVQMKDLRTDVRKGNVETARLTIKKQDDASALRNDGEKMKTQLKTLQASYEGKAHGGSKNMGGTADQVILKRVKHASKVTDTSSERVASDFLEKRLPAQDFLEEFLKERQRYHMLAAKIECMKRDIRF